MHISQRYPHWITQIEHSKTRQPKSKALNIIISVAKIANKAAIDPEQLIKVIMLRIRASCVDKEWQDPKTIRIDVEIKWTKMVIQIKIHVNKIKIIYVNKFKF